MANQMGDLGPLTLEEYLGFEKCLIVEVTSPATRRIDRGEKLDAYLAIPSLRGYVIVEGARRHVSLYSRGTGYSWMREEAVTGGSIVLPCPAMDLSLESIYEGLEFPPLQVREDVGGDAWFEEEEFEPL